MKIIMISMTNHINIREAGVKDAATLHNFVRELAEYEREPGAVCLSIEDYERFLAADYTIFEALIAEAETSPVGMAIWYPRFSTWEGPYMHLEDMYVAPEFRGRNIARSLFRELGKIAVDRSFCRIEAVTLSWNQPIQELNRRLGAQKLTEWLVWRWDKGAIQDLAASSSETTRPKHP